MSLEALGWLASGLVVLYIVMLLSEITDLRQEVRRLTVKSWVPCKHQLDWHVGQPTVVGWYKTRVKWGHHTSWRWYSEAGVWSQGVPLDDVLTCGEVHAGEVAKTSSTWCMSDVEWTLDMHPTYV